MPFQPVPNVAEVQIIYSMNNRVFMNTFHAWWALGYDQFALDMLAADMDNGPVPGLMNLLSVHLKYEKTRVIGLGSINDFSSEDASGAGFGGQQVAALSNNVAFAVTKRSNKTGRSARGRVYIPGIPTSYTQTQTGGRDFLLSAKVTLLVEAIDAFRVAINAALTRTAVIVSRYTEGQLREEGVPFDWLSTAAKDDKLDTQRRRMD